MYAWCHGLRYPYPEDRISDRVISDVSVVLRETTLTFSDPIETGSPIRNTERDFPHYNGNNRDITI